MVSRSLQPRPFEVLAGQTRVRDHHDPSEVMQFGVGPQLLGLPPTENPSAACSSVDTRQYAIVSIALRFARLRLVQEPKTNLD